MVSCDELRWDKLELGSSTFKYDRQKISTGVLEMTKSSFKPYSMDPHSCGSCYGIPGEITLIMKSNDEYVKIVVHAEKMYDVDQWWTAENLDRYINKHVEIRSFTFHEFKGIVVDLPENDGYRGIRIASSQILPKVYRLSIGGRKN